MIWRTINEVHDILLLSMYLCAIFVYDVSEVLLHISVHLWDHMLFGINSMEASRMDPQHKIALEVSYRTFEDAGLTLSDVSGSQTAVYLGDVIDNV